MVNYLLNFSSHLTIFIKKNMKKDPKAQKIWYKFCYHFLPRLIRIGKIIWKVPIFYTIVYVWKDYYIIRWSSQWLYGLIKIGYQKRKNSPEWERLAWQYEEEAIIKRWAKVSSSKGNKNWMLVCRIKFHTLTSDLKKQQGILVAAMCCMEWHFLGIIGCT